VSTSCVFPAWVAAAAVVGPIEGFYDADTEGEEGPEEEPRLVDPSNALRFLAALHRRSES